MCVEAWFCEIRSHILLLCVSTPHSTDTVEAPAYWTIPTKAVQLNMVDAPVSDLQTNGMITPSEIVASLQCDFTEEVWNSSTSGLLAITNLSRSGEPLAIEQGTTMGSVEEMELVTQYVPAWNDTDPLPVHRCSKA